MYVENTPWFKLVVLAVSLGTVWWLSCSCWRVAKRATVNFLGAPLPVLSIGRGTSVRHLAWSCGDRSLAWPSRFVALTAPLEAASGQADMTQGGDVRFLEIPRAVCRVLIPEWSPQELVQPPKT